MSSVEVTPRTQVKRLPKRAVYDREQINRILDQGVVCHVAFVVDGQPFAIPTGYARGEDTLYIHGSAASRVMRLGSDGIDVCVTVTLIDGFVLARSAFHHSMNYRSVMVLGKARLVTDTDEKRHALHLFTNHIVPGRWEETRQPTEQELKATSVLALAIEEASAKVRTGGPIDDEEDYALPVWAGVVPLKAVYGNPVDDGRVLDGVTPFEVNRLSRRGD
ncbi:MAG: pyridoxamine 5'-phosphate oxidase family protein [Acidobacteriaceae bacterium]|nr:pyridoxamine 5'-phosphate oxidase family protein [Acidobacteriaceae bacterium]